MKRLAEQEPEPQQQPETKQAKQRQPDLSRVTQCTKDQIADAVRSAVFPGSRQPIVLQIEEPEGQTVLAYTPKSRDLGCWLLQTLDAADPYLHTELMRAIVTQERVGDAFEDLWREEIETLEDLGEFLVLHDKRLRNNGAASERVKVEKSSLCNCLYTQYCRIYYDD